MYIKKRNIFSDGLTLTKQWLDRHVHVSSDSSQDLNKRVAAVVNYAYLELAEWDQSKPFPEVLKIWH